MEDQINVYILTSEPNTVYVSKIKELFSENIFEVTALNVELPETFSQQGNDIKVIAEKYRVKQALSLSKRMQNDRYVIIIKDTSTSKATPQEIAEDVRTIVNLKDVDICYLCKWLDKCSEYKNLVSISGKTSFTVKAIAPKGLQAIMFSPKGRDIILGEEQTKTQRFFKDEEGISLDEQMTKWIEEGHIDATCIFPNLIEFDITRVKSPQDYQKISECLPSEPCVKQEVKQEVIESSKPLNNKSHETYYSGLSYGLILLFIIIVVIFFLMKKKSMRL